MDAASTNADPHVTFSFRIQTFPFLVSFSYYIWDLYFCFFFLFGFNPIMFVLRLALILFLIMFCMLYFVLNKVDYFSVWVETQNIILYFV